MMGSVVVDSYCIHSCLSMTGPKYPLHLWASRLDGGAPPGYPSSPLTNEARKRERQI
jgi:hypothetical protein